MIITLTLTILWLAVITIGILSLVEKEKKQCSSSDCKDVESAYKKTLETYGGVLIGVGTVGLLITLYMWFSGHHHSEHDAVQSVSSDRSTKQNFGFRFY